MAYGKLAAYDNSRLDISSFFLTVYAHSSCSIQELEILPSNTSAVDPPGKSSDALPAAYGQAEGSNVMSAVSASGSGAAGNNCAEGTNTHKRCKCGLSTSSAGELPPPASCYRPAPNVFGTFIHSHFGLNVSAGRAIEAMNLNRSFLPFLAEACLHVLCIRDAFWCVVHINGWS